MDRLITAIDGISADFACILIVTDMRELTETFQNRIEVYKGNGGSQLRLSS